VTSAALLAVFAQLAEQHVHLEGIILKPNMVISGKKNANRASPQAVAEATVRTLKRHVPCAVPGIAFLSGGQSPAEAALHLSLINQVGSLPWQVTFSYGRALQDAALMAWAGQPANLGAGQREFGKWARLNGLARSGRYSAGMEA
jgi:fructose-bisphosphate aldolase, class I